MKKRINSNNIYRMDGIGKVFRFTLQQTFKNKGYLFSFIFLIVMMGLMGPISMISASASEKAVLNTEAINSENEATAIIIADTTDIGLDISDLESLEATSFKDARISLYNDADMISGLGDTEIGIAIEKNDESYIVRGVTSDDSKITSLQLDALTKEICNIFDDVRKSKTLSEEQFNLINGGINTGSVLSEQDYFDKISAKTPLSQVTILATVFSIIVMILVSMTVSYVITSVMEEKTSKLVENLLVSVRPLALIMGKIFAMMVYVVLMLVSAGIASGISSAVTGSFVKSEAAVEMSEHVDFTMLFGLSPWKIFVLIISLVLTYLMFSIMAGIMGSACTKAEEVGPTVMIINFISIAGYVAAILVPTADNKILYYIFSVVPFVSSYVGPVSFICGRVPFPIYFAGLLLQILFIMFMFMLCAKVYRKLIVNDSKKLNLGEILKLAGEGEA